MSGQSLPGSRVGGATLSKHLLSLRLLLIIQYARLSLAEGLRGVLWSEVQQALALGASIAAFDLLGLAVAGVVSTALGLARASMSAARRR